MFAELHLTVRRPLRLRALQWVTRHVHGAARLGVAALPDHLRRDLGFLDGHAPPLRDPLRDLPTSLHPATNTGLPKRPRQSI